MVAVCPNPFRDSGLEITKHVLELLRREGAETAVCPVFAGQDQRKPPLGGLETRSLKSATEGCDLAVVIGGDGTLLAVARELYELPIPILGINLGTKGFMCALEPGELDLVARAARGEYRLSRRMMLDVRLKRAGETVYSDCALNDAVIHGYRDCIRMTACCGGARIIRFSGDGIVLATPTGSTGYSMSAGGPIVEPTGACIIVSPICAHMMGARSFVLDPQQKVSVVAERLHGRPAYLSVDGTAGVDLVNEDVLEISRSEHCTLMADLGLKNFFDMAYEKLN